MMVDGNAEYRIIVLLCTIKKKSFRPVRMVMVLDDQSNVMKFRLLVGFEFNAMK